MIQNDFKYREQFNVMYLRMQGAGIIKKAHDEFMINKLKKKYDAKDHYQVELEGVLFEHVKFICFGFSLIFPIVLIVLAIEIIHNWIAMRMKIEPIIKISCENQEFTKHDENSFDETSNQDMETYSTVDNISFNSTELMLDELMEIIDLESN